MFVIMLNNICGWIKLFMVNANTHAKSLPNLIYMICIFTQSFIIAKKFNYMQYNSRYILSHADHTCCSVYAYII